MTVTISPASNVNGMALPALVHPSASRTGTLSFQVNGVVDPADWCMSIGKSTGAPTTHAGLSPVVDSPLANGFANVSLRQTPDTLFIIVVNDPGFDVGAGGFVAGDHLWMAFFPLTTPISGSVPDATHDLGLVVA